jgi:hypothetical protein
VRQATVLLEHSVSEPHATRVERKSSGYGPVVISCERVSPAKHGVEARADEA